MGSDIDAEAEGRDRAAKFRHEHHLGVQPLGDLVVVIEQTTGVDVAVLDVEPDEHGLVMRDPQRGAVFIGVARTPHPMRQRSTLAHELGHVLFNDWTTVEMKDWAASGQEEDRCRAFARHLLAPIDGLHEFLGDRPVALPTLSDVVQRFLVSPAIAAIALEQAGYIDHAISKEWAKLHTPQVALRFGWSDQYEAMVAESDRRRAPQRLLARAVNGYALGVLSPQTVARLRGVPLETVEMELRDAGVTPTERPIAWAEANDLPDAGEVDFSDLDEDPALGEADTPSAQDAG